MMARLLRGIGANLYAQLVTAAVQLVSVPVLVAAWGPERFGLWTLLTAAPAALAFADGGLVLAGGNAVTMLAARGDAATAAALFRRMARQVGCAVGALGIAVLLAVWLVPEWLLDRLLPLPAAAARPALGLLVLVTLLGVLGAIPGAAFRASGRYAFGTAVGATLRLAEVAAVAVAAMTGQGFLGAALAWLGVRLAATPIVFLLAYRDAAWLRCRAVPSAPLPPLGKAARAALLLPACFALSLQGVTLAIGLSLSPQAVGAFAAARTLARAAVQAMGLVTHALMPEMAAAAGRGDPVRLAAIVRLNRQAAAALLMPGWLALLVLGPRLFALWTGDLPLAAGTLPMLASAALLHGLWLSQANLLLAVNRHAGYAGAFFAAALATVLAAGAAAAWGGTAAAAGATLLGEAAMVLRLARLMRAERPVAWQAEGARP